MGKRKRISREMRRLEAIFRSAVAPSANGEGPLFELEAGNGFETSFRLIAPEDAPRRIAELREAARREGGLFLGPE
jgi:hypothetical protein